MMRLIAERDPRDNISTTRVTRLKPSGTRLGPRPGMTRPTPRTVIKQKPKTVKDAVKEYVIPLPGDPTKLNKSPAQNLNTVKQFGTPKSGGPPIKSIKKAPPAVKKEQVGDVPFTPDKESEQKQMIALQPPQQQVKQAGISMPKNWIIYAIVGVIILVLLTRIK